MGIERERFMVDIDREDPMLTDPDQDLESQRGRDLASASWQDAPRAKTKQRDAVVDQSYGADESLLLQGDDGDDDFAADSEDDERYRYSDADYDDDDRDPADDDEYVERDDDYADTDEYADSDGYDEYDDDYESDENYDDEDVDEDADIDDSEDSDDFAERDRDSYSEVDAPRAGASTSSYNADRKPWAQAIGADIEDDEPEDVAAPVAPAAQAADSRVETTIDDASAADVDDTAGADEADEAAAAATADDNADGVAADVATASAAAASVAAGVASGAAAGAAEAALAAGKGEAQEGAGAEDSEAEETVTFKDLHLSAPVLAAVQHEGFEQPTPIQLKAIPIIFSGRDMIGQAQTGTGKTAAFALPILSSLPANQRQIFALILEPTRELALQVAESFSRFAHYIDNFRVAPIYGGASYDNQLRSLRHGAQVVVATPGRLMDLIKKDQLDFSSVQYVVLDEADEMLRMGFIEDVDWILDKIPTPHQTALFSATMPLVIRRIARQHLIDPQEVHFQAHTTTATTVRQRYWVVSGVHKIDAMTRILEVEQYDAVLVFVRTKTDAEDVANKLIGRGLACAALHGDIPQRQREKIIERLKNGSLDIIIATDVAARGLDVDRITHVFNYDIPYDAESYVHRIGRTGRAGRTGEAILFVSPRERKALRQIERITKQHIEPMRMPTIKDVNKRRLENFRNQIIETIDQGGLGEYLEVVSDILSDDSIEPELLAAALAKMAQRDGSLLLDESSEFKRDSFDERVEHSERRHGGPPAEPVPLRSFPDIKMVRYRLAVGRRDSVKPGQIVGAIANEANIESKYIGEISIYESFSTVDLPDGMPKATMQVLARARVCGRALDLRVYTQEPPPRHHREHSERPERSSRPERSERGPRGERDRERDRDRDRERDRDRDRERSERSERRRFHERNEDDPFSYMDDGEYFHEKGDVNGNSINYQPRRKNADEYAVGVGYGYNEAFESAGVLGDRSYESNRKYPAKGSHRGRPSFEPARHERSRRPSSGSHGRPRPRFR